MINFKYNANKKLSDFNSRSDFISELYHVGLINENNKSYFFSLFNNVSSHYRKFYIPKKYSYDNRCITAPDENLKNIQVIINQLIKNQLAYNKFEFEKSSQAYQKGKGIFTNAQIHRNKKYILHLDLSDFFPSIHFGRVSGYFEKNHNFKLNKPMAYFFADLCCYKGALAQGSPSSPIISNLIGEGLDHKLLKICKKYHFTYSRYADDLIFSTNDNYIIINKLEEFINESVSTITTSGFNINWDKLNIMGPNTRHTVTGLSNNKKVSSTLNFYKNTRAMANSFYVNNSFIDVNKHYNGYNTTNFVKASQVIEGRYTFINDIENKNRKLYNEHKTGEEYHSITAIDFQDRHNISNIKNYNHVYRLSGKELSYSKFMFYKKFLSEDRITIFTEGKTDPRYIRTALKALNINMPINAISPQIEQEKSSNFSRIFNLSKGGVSLMDIIRIYKGDSESSRHPLIPYYSYFENKLLPIRPTIMLLDFEYAKKPISPLMKIIKYLKKYDFDEVSIKSNLEKKGYQHIFGNLYLVTTTDLKNSVPQKDREIEDYFSDSFLNDIYGNQKFHFEKSTNPSGRDLSTPLSKNDFSIYIKSLTSDPTKFQGFKILFDIFNNVEYDYIDSVLDKITIVNSNTLYNILDSNTVRNYIADHPHLLNKFLLKYSEIFKLGSINH